MVFQLLQSDELMKALQSVGIGLALLLVTGSSLAQNGNMMNGGTGASGWMGGYGGYWVPILALAIIAGLVIWVVKQKK